MSDETTDETTEAEEIGQPTPEEIAQVMYERLAAARVPDVLVQTMATFADLAAIRLGLGPEGDERGHAGEARLAIDVLTTLLPIAEAAFGEQAGAFRQAVSELQMAFVERAKLEGGVAPEGGAPPPPPAPPTRPIVPTPILAPQQPPGDGGLWVPPHHRQ
jgi:hypothetical protein